MLHNQTKFSASNIRGAPSPRFNSKKESTQVKSMRLSTEVVQAVEELAEKENRNFTNMVETILIRALEPY